MPDTKPGAPDLHASDDETDNKNMEDRVDGMMDTRNPEPAAVSPPETTSPVETAAMHDYTAEDKLDDAVTDKAVDDIIVNDSDSVLAAEDAANTRNQAAPSASGSKSKLRRIVRDKRVWAGLAVVLLVIFGLPLTRYKILGLVIKKPVTITVRDSRSGTPVSNAQVHLDSVGGKTDANGKVYLKSGVGSHRLEITKLYYRTASSHYFVGFKSAAPAQTSLVATGRLVPITVINKITGQPLKGVEIRVLDTTAKTDAKGHASVALPATASQDPAKLVLSGYNTAAVNIEVTDSLVKANSFTITPAGHIYFLSNLEGNIDVVKADLDGANRKTVLPGTGKEDQNATSLLASRDWRYLVLKARRDTALPSLYLIDTASDKVTQFDTGDAAFTLVGWYGHSFVYDLTRNSLQIWQPGRQVIKSYDAENLQLNQLDQNQAEGNAGHYSQQNFANYYLVNGAVTYTTQWYIAYGTDAGTKTDTIRTVQPNGQGKKDYQSLPVSSVSGFQAALYEPQAVYYAVYPADGSKVTYYSFENQEVKPASIDSGGFNKTYPTFLLSPSGNQTFWTELRDGKNSLFIGDSNAQNKKQLATFSKYTPYGWYSDAYTLVSKDSSELYIMPATGAAPDQQPFKITDYYKPAQTFNGYGYGYGGL